MKRFINMTLVLRVMIMLRRAPSHVMWLFFSFVLLLAGPLSFAETKEIRLAGALPRNETINIVDDSSCQEIFNQETYAKLEKIFGEKPAKNTDLVTTKVVSSIYGIPRNYFVNFIGFGTLKVTYPGFKPLTDETENCFLPRHQAEKFGCTALELRLGGGRGPDGLPFTNTKAFSNYTTNMNIKPRSGPFGYDIYDVGPEEARIETYRKEEGDIFFHCHIYYYKGIRDGLCDDAFLINDENSVKFFFSLSLIGNIPDIETGVRSLMSNFSVKEKQQ